MNELKNIFIKNNLQLKTIIIQKVDYERSQESRTLIMSNIAILPKDVDLPSFLDIPHSPAYYIYDYNYGTAILFFAKTHYATETLRDLKSKIINFRFFEVDYADFFTELHFFNMLDKNQLMYHIPFLEELGYKVTSKQEVVLSQNRKTASISSLTSKQPEYIFNESADLNVSNSKNESNENLKLDDTPKVTEDQSESAVKLKKSKSLDSDKILRISPSTYHRESAFSVKYKNPLRFFAEKDEIDLALADINKQSKATNKVMNTYQTQLCANATA